MVVGLSLPVMPTPDNPRGGALAWCRSPEIAVVERLVGSLGD
jgi:hypothetical protein